MQHVDFSGAGDRRWLIQQVNQPTGRLLPTALTSQFTCLDADAIARIEARHAETTALSVSETRIQHRAAARREQSAALLSGRLQGCASREQWRMNARVKKLEERLICAGIVKKN